MTSVTIVGAGTLAPDAHRHCAAHWVESGTTRLLMDCGSGTLHGLAQFGLPWTELTHIAISHYHADHVSDLVPLVYAFHHGQVPPRAAPLTLLGPVGFSAQLERLAAALGDRLLAPEFPLEIVELRPGEDVELGHHVTVSAQPTAHTDESVCFRVETADGAIGYSGDTGPSRAVAGFLEGSRVLIAECYQPDPATLDGHLSPSRLAELAGAASPELLVITHVATPHDPEDMVAAVAAAGYPGRVLAGRDGLRVTLGTSLTVDPPGTDV